MEDDYKRLLEEVRDAYFVVQDGKLVLINNRYAEIHGYTKEELIDMPVGKLIEPSSRTMATELHNIGAQGTEVPHRVQVISITKDGSRIPVEVFYWETSYRGKSAIAGTATVVSERNKQHAEAVKALEDEKRRLARALHDDTIQELLVICHRLHDVVGYSEQDLVERGRQQLTDTRLLVEQIINELRNHVLNLRPAILDDLGLVPALSWLISRLASGTGIRAKLNISGNEISQAKDTELALFRIAQEAMSNIRKHSGASSAIIRLEFRKNKVALSIKDDGRGFDFPPTPNYLSSQGKLGLAGMIERANLLNGVLLVQSAQGKGTTIRVEVPVLNNL